MDEGPLPPLFSTKIPRFAPPRGHTRTPSRSPTRANLADDILSDLSPATTLEAFTNPSGKLKASIEAATPSERAFGLRATLASKKIQEWVEELSAWPWPAGGSSLGFQVPSAKRGKLSDDRGRRNSYTESPEPTYIGSLLSTEVETYENRIDDITADMEDLNVEEIKRQVLNTHFSPRSRPSSSASNAPPMPSLFASYTRMDDFTAVITATVLHALPNLSRLNRLMDVWNIRLSVLRKVPPLMIALDDAEIAIKSGWTTIEAIDSTLLGANEDAYLSRKTFEIMRGVLQDKVTTLGQDLDYMLDTLEGREDTLPDAWLDRMENIENDYGSWVVSGDRKVREGEWARLAKARKEEDDARKLKEAEAAETARRKAEEEARWKAQLDAEKAEVARLKAEQEAREAKRQEAEAAAIAREKEENARAEVKRLEELRKAGELETARLVAAQQAEAEVARLRAKEEAEEVARQKSLQEAQGLEDARLLAAQQAEHARVWAEREARELARQKALDEAKDAEDARLLAEQVEAAKVQAEKDAKQNAHEKALEATRVEFARLVAEEQAEAERKGQAEQRQIPQFQAPKRTETNDSIAIIVSGARDAARQAALKDSEDIKIPVLLPRQQAEQDTAQPDAADMAIPAKYHADEAASEASKPQAEDTELQQRESDTRRNAPQEACVSKQRHLGLKALVSPSDSEEYKASRRSEVAEDPQQPEHDTKTRTTAQQDSPTLVSTTTKLMLSGMTIDEADEGLFNCDRCEEIRLSKPNSPLPSPSALTRAISSGAIRTQNFVDSFFTSNFEDAVKPQVSRYAPFDGQHEVTEPAIRTTEVEYKRGSSGLDLASSIHLDDSFPQTPTSSTVSSTARVLTSPTSEGSSPPPSKVLPFSHGYTTVGQVSPPLGACGPVFQPLEEGVNAVEKATSGSPRKAINFTFFHAEDGSIASISVTRESDDERSTVVDTPEHSNTGIPVDGGHSDHESIVARSSGIFSYPASEPSPEIFEAQPPEYFATPTNGWQRSSNTTPSGSVPVTPKPLHIRASANTTLTKSPIPESKRHSRESTSSILSPVAEEFMSFPTGIGGDSACNPCEVAVRDLELLEKETEQATELPVLARKMSISRIDSPIRRISTPRRESISSEASTLAHGGVSESPSSTLATPIAEDSIESSIEQSPSAGRIGSRGLKALDVSPPNSPPPGVAKRPSLLLPSTPQFSSPAPSTPFSESLPPTPLDAPVFSNIDVSTIPIITSPKKVSTDDQMHQQISSLLESIPARIHLTTSSDTPSTPFTSQNLRPKKTRRSMTPSYRSSSSMSNYSTSSRAPTPSFTLAPAFGKTSSRPRPQSSNPEIKLYHLSRSTGEAPIKLFVRLVGEHGERVMVRVGGGWADLGEYLKEYASHHGRRSAAMSDDKIQIQDFSSRNVSSSSTATLRGIGRSTPDPYSRPQSVMERERPGSSLNMRKTRRSVGESSSSTISMKESTLAPERPNIQLRAPSTPLPSTSSLYHKGTLTTTPGSNTSTTTSTSDHNRDRHNRSSSRLSWTSDDISSGSAHTGPITNFSASLPLGLAGPKSRNVQISERDQEWVESMKEKVRLASAEKEKRDRDSSLASYSGGGGGKGKDRERESLWAGGRESSLGFGGKRESGGRESLGGRESSLGFGSKTRERESLGARESRASFGEMEKVGKTKRLFRKGL